jgi:hypothetical protein
MSVRRLSRLSCHHENLELHAPSKLGRRVPIAAVAPIVVQGVRQSADGPESGDQRGQLSVRQPRSSYQMRGNLDGGLGPGRSSEGKISRGKLFLT